MTLRWGARRYSARATSPPLLNKAATSNEVGHIGHRKITTIWRIFANVIPECRTTQLRRRSAVAKRLAFAAETVRSAAS